MMIRITTKRYQNTAQHNELWAVCRLTGNYPETGFDEVDRIVTVKPAHLCRSAKPHAMLNPVFFQNFWFKSRGTMTGRPKAVPSCSQSFLTVHCRATAPL